ncbi:MAG: DUF4974 domain-containing protein [Prolixibacteraceae bacterium]|jgi:ferric-dicitrate binding protein FerR (iron transport regulator)|nr:DUF4974 domain-containing protein [Prolixibacteraceae bacterium]
MQNSNKIQLLQKFLNGNITDKELKILFVWLNSEKGTREYQNLFDDRQAFNEFEKVGNIDSSMLFAKIEARMRDKKLLRRKEYIIRFRNAAAIFLLGLFIPLVYFTVFLPMKDKTTVVFMKENLSNEKIRQVTLSDGTAVWLMSGSTITYPSDFSGMKTRNVEVTGEAFFNVAKDSLHPFILNLGELGLKVVGTSFNVTNYEDEDRINVVLKTGKVNLFRGKYSPDNQFVHLVSGQLGTLKKGEPELLISEVDVAKYTSWIDGILQFRDDPLSIVLKKLGRWYNIGIEIKDPKVAEFPFSATLKNENLDQIVDLLAYSTPFKYSILKTNGVTKLVIERK